MKAWGIILTTWECLRAGGVNSASTEGGHGPKSAWTASASIEQDAKAVEAHANPFRDAEGIPNAMNKTLSHEQIAARAFEVYASRGYHDGNAADDWYKAESSLKHEAGCSLEHCSDAAHGHHHHGQHDTHRRHGA